MAKKKRSTAPVSCTSGKPEVHLSTSADETRRIGIAFGKRLKAGDTVYLSGDLGSGKTTFVQGVVKSFGIRRFARSSSFILVNEYDTRAVPLYHMDLYRLEGCEIGSLGLEEYFCGKGICLVEWADRLTRLSPPYYDVRLSWQGEHERKIEICHRKK